MRWWLLLGMLASGCGGGGGKDRDAVVNVDGGVGGDGASGETTPPLDFTPLSNIAAKELADTGADGAAIVVTHHGRVVFSAGLGTKVGATGPIKTSTLFRISSITKTFTALSAIDLVEQGKLGLDTTVGSLVPDFLLANSLDEAKTITLRQLLSHTSGVGDGPPNASSVEPKDDGQLGRWLVSEPFQRTFPLNFAPGRVFDYSNNGYAVAARMIELAAGKTFSLHLRASVLAPMKITRFFASPTEVRGDGDYTEGKNGKGVIVPVDADFEPVHVGSGAMAPWWTSADELAKLGQAIAFDPAWASKIKTMSKDLVDAEEPWIADTYWHHRHGLGLAAYDGVAIGDRYYPLPILGHEGGTGGFSSMTYTVPSQELVFVALANHGGAYFDKTFAQAMTIAGLPASSAMPKKGVDPADYAKVVGTYHDDFQVGDVVVRTSGGKLVLDVPKGGLADLELVPKHGLSFTCEGPHVGLWFDETITFIPGKDGRVELMRNRFWVAKR